jgi:hypothetical protein
MKRGVKGVLIFGIFLMAILPIVSAGVGISWDKESSLVPENTKTCLTYKVYNPFSSDVFAEITTSEEFDEILTYQESEVKEVPAGTSSSEAIPVQFCFKTPKIYERDCLIGNSLICEKTCEEEMKVFEGKVIVKESNDPEFTGGQGSATQMSVAAPMRIRVQCVAHDRNYSFIYLVVLVLAAILLLASLHKKKGKGKKKK